MKMDESKGMDIKLFALSTNNIMNVKTQSELVLIQKYYSKWILAITSSERNAHMPKQYISYLLFLLLKDID